MNDKLTQKDECKKSTSVHLYSCARAWYFSVAEGIAIGPYANRQEATAGILNYFDYLNVNIQNSPERIC